jgi:hypothetical protein
MKSLRKKFGEIEYLRITEITRRGWPHYHLLIRSAYLPHPVVKQRWTELTRATIVDLRQVQKTFSAYWYLTKYLSKLHSLGWSDRHVSFSARFFPPQPPPPPLPFQYDKPSVEAIHPVTFLARHYANKPIARVHGKFLRLPRLDSDNPPESLPDADTLPVTLENRPTLKDQTDAQSPPVQTSLEFDRSPPTLYDGPFDL